MKAIGVTGTAARATLAPYADRVVETLAELTSVGIAALLEQAGK